MAADDDGMINHLVASHDEWLEARRPLLDKEKAFTRQCDDMSRLQRSLPWERVTKAYVFDGRDGRQSLADLFGGYSQLVVYHFMFHPDDKAGCLHCSLRADAFAGIAVDLRHRDVTMIVVSRAPYVKLARYQARMGWSFKWVSSGGSDFNFDYQASFTPEDVAAKRALYNYRIGDPQAPEREGHSIFYKDQSETIFQTYSCYDRGNDKLNLHYHYLDLVPHGRNENRHGPYWVRTRRVRSIASVSGTRSEVQRRRVHRHSRHRSASETDYRRWGDGDIRPTTEELMRALAVDPITALREP